MHTACTTTYRFTGKAGWSAPKQDDRRQSAQAYPQTRSAQAIAKEMLERAEQGRETRDIDDGAGRISVTDELATQHSGWPGRDFRGNTALPRRGDGELPRWPS